jgi:SepF-like predicted cell division protein (DUF552 family)
MKLFGKKDDENLLDSPKKTLGFSNELNSVMQDFFIKKYELQSLEQLDDIKNHLRSRKILIINANKFLERGNINILEFKEIIDELKAFISEYGGSIGRLGKNYLILTPNAQIRISN